MEDKKVFLSFLAITLLLNIFLLFMLVKGLNFYIGNIKTIQNTQNEISEFKKVYDEFKVKTSTERGDLTRFKNRFSSTTSIAGYIEKLVFKTNEKKIQLYKNTVLSTNDKEILMEITLYGTFDSISRVIKEIEEELPLTEITESSIEVSGSLVKVNLNLRILLNSND